MPDVPRSTGLALDLANTWDPYLDMPERLPDVDALEHLLTAHGFDDDVNRTTLRNVLALRTLVRTILGAPDPASLVARLNDFLAELEARVAVEARPGRGWQLTLQARGSLSLRDTLELRLARELVDLVGANGPERIRSCRAAPCIEFFVDTSRGGRRMYCSRRCANRVNAARHRRRGERSRSGS